jgi:hypothetical protein
MYCRTLLEALLKCPFLATTIQAALPLRFGLVSLTMANSPLSLQVAYFHIFHTVPLTMH